MIENFYEFDNDDSYREACQMKMTASIEINTVSMIDAIAQRFGTTRTAIVSDVLSNAALEMFHALSDVDKKEIARKADVDATALLKKNGVEITRQAGVGITEENQHESHHWRWQTVSLEDSDANS